MLVKLPKQLLTNKYRICLNKGITKGVSWNILAKDFDINTKYHILAKTNMIREFGEFLDEQMKPKKVNKKILNPPIHQEPKF